MGKRSMKPRETCFEPNPLKVVESWDSFHGTKLKANCGNCKYWDRETGLCSPERAKELRKRWGILTYEEREKGRKMAEMVKVIQKELRRDSYAGENQTRESPSLN